MNPKGHPERTPGKFMHQALTEGPWGPQRCHRPLYPVAPWKSPKSPAVLFPRSSTSYLSQTSTRAYKWCRAQHPSRKYCKERSSKLGLVCLLFFYATGNLHTYPSSTSRVTAVSGTSATGRQTVLSVHAHDLPRLPMPPAPAESAPTTIGSSSPH